MKKIYLIRHAKAENSDDIKDFDRTLNGRGKEDAKFMAKRLRKYGIFPDIIYTSPAKRALKTTKILADFLEYDKKKIVSLERLYESSLRDYLDVITQTSDAHESLFLVAHNPTITEVGEYLSGAILISIPTSAIVCICFDVDSFKEIGEESGDVLFFDYPKKHKAKI